MQAENYIGKQSINYTNEIKIFNIGHFIIGDFMIRKEVYSHTMSKTMAVNPGSSSPSSLDITGLTSAACSILHTGSTVSPTITVVFTRSGQNMANAPNVAVTYSLHAVPNGKNSKNIYSFTVPARGTLNSQSVTVTIPYTGHEQISHIVFTLVRNQGSFQGRGYVNITSITVTYSTSNKTVTAGNSIQDTDINAISGDVLLPYTDEGTVISKTPLTSYGTLSGLNSAIITASEWNNATVTKTYSYTI